MAIYETKSIAAQVANTRCLIRYHLKRGNVAKCKPFFKELAALTKNNPVAYAQSKTWVNNIKRQYLSE